MVQFVSARRTYLLLSFCHFMHFCSRRHSSWSAAKNSFSHCEILCHFVRRFCEYKPGALAVQHSFEVLLSVLLINFTLLCAPRPVCSSGGNEYALASEYLSVFEREAADQPVVEKTTTTTENSRFFLLLVDIKNI